MTNFIPNEVDVGVAVQSQPDSQDFQNVLAGIKGNGVWKVGGECAVTAQGTPDDTVAIAEGVVVLDGRTYQVAADAVSPLFADNSGVGDRIDLVVYDTGAGAIEIVEGAEHATIPVMPTPDANHVVLAAVLITSDEDGTPEPNVITADIIDKRVFVPCGLGTVYPKATANLTNEILVYSNWEGARSFYSSTAQDEDAPFGTVFYVSAEITIDRLVIHVSQLLDAGADADSPVLRLALYRAGDNNMPGKLVIAADAGIDISAGTGSTGTKLQAINSAGTVTLPPGLYFLMAKQDNVTNSTQQIEVYDGAGMNGALIPGWSGDASAFDSGTGWRGVVSGPDLDGAFADPFVGATLLTGSSDPFLFGVRNSS